MIYTFYSPDNALISGIKAILAEEYSRELSKKINNSYKRRIEAAKNGEKISIVNNSRSLGYDKVNGELVINEKEAEAVRMIFNMYASGEGLRAISNTLYDMGYRNRSGNEIDPTTISRMLSSEKYKGVYVIIWTVNCTCTAQVHFSFFHRTAAWGGVFRKKTRYRM